MPRPAPRVAPATRATRPVSGLREDLFGAIVDKRNSRLVYVKNEMSPRRRKAEDVDVFAALVRVMLRCGPAELTLRAIAAEAGVTAGALVQRFGSKRELLHAHARHGAATGDIGFGTPLDARTASPLQAVRAATAVHARLAESPRAALRNLAYLQNDLADLVLRRHLLRLKRRRGLVTSSWWPMPYLWANCGPIPTFGRWRA